MNRALLWLAAAAVAIAMSVTWDDDGALQATADDVADAIQAARAAAPFIDQPALDEAHGI